MTEDPIQNLIYQLSRLPGIGERTATRLAYHLIQAESNTARSLASALNEAVEKIQLCTQCFTYTTESLCRICADPNRNQEVIFVVEKPSDILSVERSGFLKGIFHVLHGVLSPVKGIGVSELRLDRLASRIHQLGSVKEVILALNPSLDSETTALVLAKVLAPLEVKLSQLALGLPAGGQLEYSDRNTVMRALENRAEIKL